MMRNENVMVWDVEHQSKVFLFLILSDRQKFVMGDGKWSALRECGSQELDEKTFKKHICVCVVVQMNHNRFKDLDTYIHAGSATAKAHLRISIRSLKVFFAIQSVARVTMAFSRWHRIRWKIDRSHPKRGGRAQRDEKRGGRETQLLNWSKNSIN